jgi:flagellar basal-body rod protein FlgB
MRKNQEWHGHCWWGGDMVDGLFQQTNYQAAKALLGAAEMRHEAIASNLAHVETPQYKRIDVETSFEKKFVASLKSGNTDRLSNLRATVGIDRKARANRVDGNTVELEKELLALNRNSLQHSFVTDRISGTMARLSMAITGKA